MKRILGIDPWAPHAHIQVHTLCMHTHIYSIPKIPGPPAVVSTLQIPKLLHTLLSPNLFVAEPRNLLLTGVPSAPNILGLVLKGQDGDVEEKMAKGSF